MSTPFPPQNQQPFQQQPTGGYNQQPGYPQGAQQGYGHAMPGPTPSPYGGAPMGPAPRKSNRGHVRFFVLRALELSVADLDLQPKPVQQPHAVSQSPADLQPQAFLQLVQFLGELGVR